MIRFVLISTLSVLLILVLYLPSVAPPDAFHHQIEVEYRNLRVSWSPVPANRVAARFKKWRQQTSRHFLKPDDVGEADSKIPTTVEIQKLNQRVFGSAYFRSVEALFDLAMFRLAIFNEWIPYLVPVLIACVADGYFRRLVRGKTLRFQNPELYGLAIGAVIVSLCGFSGVLVLPIALPRITIPVIFLIIALCLNQAITHYPIAR